MPRGGVAHRAGQMALLAGLQHEKATDPRIGELFGELEGSALVRYPLAPPAAVNVRELRRVYARLTRFAPATGRGDCQHHFLRPAKTGPLPIGMPNSPDSDRGWRRLSR